MKPYEALWVATHPDLRGDEFLGEDALKRFLPSRFDADGFAIDAMGSRCTQIACPKCHLPIPRLLFELKPLFVSIIGAPSSGKSYFLASCIWQTRQRLRQFNVSFSDADPVANQILSGYEQKLFLTDQPDTLVAIPKTEEDGELYQSVNYGSHSELYARPFVFSLQPTKNHALIEGNKTPVNRASRALCLYDNAGEHFQAIAGSELSPATDHLALSEALMFVFDPLQHPRFRQTCAEFSQDPQLTSRKKNHRQDEILQEAAKRIRQKANLPQHQPIEKPLIVVVNKFDVWKNLLKDFDPASLPIYPTTRQGVTGVNVTVLETVSNKVRALLNELAPEFVAATETFSDDVTFLPVSPQGCSPHFSDSSNLLGVKPGELNPVWAEVPLLLAIAKAKCALMPRLSSSGKAQTDEESNEFKPRLYGAG